jgi:hypothetical protein
MRHGLQGFVHSTWSETFYLYSVIGDANEICGGGDGLSVYQLQASVVQSYKTWSYANCYEDSINDRKIPNPGWVSGPMTVEGCLEACYNDGYTVAGLEWSQECYCGYNLPPQVATDNRCDMSCKGLCI